MGTRETMAARITASAVDFVSVGAKIPAAQKAAFGALQNKVSAHQRKVNSLPASIPAIDFDSYRAKITVAGMVDNFAAKYAALDIAYPSDQGSLAALTLKQLSRRQLLLSSRPPPTPGLRA